jgi:hypothetical protein
MEDPDSDRSEEKNRQYLRTVEWVVGALMVLAVLATCSRIGNPNCVAVGEDRWGNIQEDCN